MAKSPAQIEEALGPNAPIPSAMVFAFLASVAPSTASLSRPPSRSTMLHRSVAGATFTSDTRRRSRAAADGELNALTRARVCFSALRSS